MTIMIYIFVLQVPLATHHNLQNNLIIVGKQDTEIYIRLWGCPACDKRKTIQLEGSHMEYVLSFTITQSFITEEMLDVPRYIIQYA